MVAAKVDKQALRDMIAREAAAIPAPNSSPVIPSALREVRCKKRIWRREIAVECGKLLLRCEPDVITSEYAVRVEIRCPNCGSVYTLEDFRQ